MRRTTTGCIRQLLSSAAPTRPSNHEIPLRSAQCLRPFSNTSTLKADRPASDSQLTDIFALTRTKREDPRNQMAVRGSGGALMASALMPSNRPEASILKPIQEPHHFHIYATKHNTHITVTTPNRDPLISVSCGNIGFRKSGRKHYDSAFQLAGFVIGQMKERGITNSISEMEVVLRGFGAGREAVTKALLGAEGSELRKKIRKVADATRLKFGGVRGKKPRRLG